MDANKLKVLKEIEYEVQECCGLCVHSDIRPTSLWGVCTIHEYTHEKHTGEPRDLSVHFVGRCDSFAICEKKRASLEGFVQLVHGSKR